MPIQDPLRLAGSFVEILDGANFAESDQRKRLNDFFNDYASCTVEQKEYFFSYLKVGVNKREFGDKLNNKMHQFICYGGVSSVPIPAWFIEFINYIHEVVLEKHSSSFDAIVKKEQENATAAVHLATQFLEKIDKADFINPENRSALDKIFAAYAQFNTFEKHVFFAHLHSNYRNKLEIKLNPQIFNFISYSRISPSSAIDGYIEFVNHVHQVEPDSPLSLNRFIEYKQRDGSLKSENQQAHTQQKEAISVAEEFIKSFQDRDSVKLRNGMIKILSLSAEEKSHFYTELKKNHFQANIDDVIDVYHAGLWRLMAIYHKKAIEHFSAEINKIAHTNRAKSTDLASFSAKNRATTTMAAPKNNPNFAVDLSISALGQGIFAHPRLPDEPLSKRTMLRRILKK